MVVEAYVGMHAKREGTPDRVSDENLSSARSIMYVGSVGLLKSLVGNGTECRRLCNGF